MCPLADQHLWAFGSGMVASLIVASTTTERDHQHENSVLDGRF
jgi:hypothetical protein